MEDYIRKWVAGYAQTQHITDYGLFAHWVIKCWKHGGLIIIRSFDNVLDGELSAIHRHYVELARYHCVRHTSFVCQDKIIVKHRH